MWWCLCYVNCKPPLSWQPGCCCPEMTGLIGDLGNSPPHGQLAVEQRPSNCPPDPNSILQKYCQYLPTWSVGVSWHQSMAERMADGKKQKPPSAIALAVSVANASQLHLLTILPAVETSLDSKEMMGSVRKRWTTTVNHMEEMLHDDPDHGHALMVNLSCKIYSFSNANWSAMSLG